ncbi:Putative Kinase phosphorylation protein [[Torrubiella] hemipterigena]|uniref:Putative Kinase phosphorylation protein n=1 Tax=[Torrubiella] hemipterigena TaxID=1531966 RepID=A0A0A1SKR2_9HYPO|nr:Putative Kinase phosphorylation protein [[Torrubiella] hemipterigena]
MDLLQTVRKTGSRGGVNFSWDEVASSSRRENYLGHSLKAPVGRWQQGRDLNWYANSGATAANADETDEERIARERKEEMRKIKEAEEDAMAVALGLPVKQRNTTGANDIEIQNKRPIGPTANPDDAPESKDKSSNRDRDRSHHHGESSRRHHRRHRSRSRGRDSGREHRSRRRSRSRDGERSRDLRPHHERSRRKRSRSPGRRDRHRRDGSRERRRSRSREGRNRERSPRQRGTKE